MSDKKWYAIYVKSRTEKKCEQDLLERGIEAYLPLSTKIKQWSDRKKKVQSPLFSGYLFVNIPQKDYYNVLESSYVVCYITFEGKAVAIPEKQIDSLKLLSKYSNEFELELSNENFDKGERVEIVDGQFKGFFGIVKQSKKGTRFLVEIEHINSSVSLELPGVFLSKEQVVTSKKII